MTDDTQPLGRHQSPEPQWDPPAYTPPPVPQRSRFWVWWNYGRKWPWVVAFFVLLFMYAPPPTSHDSPAPTSVCQIPASGG